LRSRSNGLVVAAAAAALLLTIAFFLVIHGPAPSAEGGSSSPITLSEAAKEDGPLSLEAEANDATDTREALSEPSRSTEHSEVPRKEASRDGSGKLVITAIDADTRSPLDRIRVRAASGTRLADRQSDRGSARLQLTLTPDTYSVFVWSQGYEPAELPLVRVPPAETVTLDPVALSPGSARIVGMVIGSGWSAGALRVELLGEGRRPCGKCPFGADPVRPGSPAPSLAWTRAAPCHTCGYAGKSSLLAVQRSGLFTFQNLASGSYALRLVDAQNRALGVSKPVDLQAAESLSVELEYVAPRTVCVEIVDTDGTSLATEWAARCRGRPLADVDSGDDAELEPMVGEPPRFQCAFRAGDIRLAQSSFVPPAPLGRSAMHPEAFSSRRLGIGQKTKTTDDRTRANSEPLRPENQAPSVEPSVLSARVDEQGLACVEDVPSLALMMDVQCDSFVATVAIPASRGITRVRVQLTHKANNSPIAGAEVTNPTITFREFEASHWH
jgi:hypothetical protein